MKLRPARPRKDPFTKDRKTALETIISMISPSTSYKVPTVGRSTAERGFTALDACKAVSFSPNKLGGDVVMAIALQKTLVTRELREQVEPAVLRDLRLQRAMPGVVKGPLWFRVTLVLPDAFADTVTHKRRDMRASAANFEMPVKPYQYIHKHIVSYLESNAEDAADDATTWLFSKYAREVAGSAPHVAVMRTPEGETIVQRGATRQALAQRMTRGTNIDVDALIEAMSAAGARERSLGVLTLAGKKFVTVYAEV